MNSLAIRQPVRIATMIVVMACLGWPVAFVAAQPPADPPAQDLQIEVTKKDWAKKCRLSTARRNGSCLSKSHLKIPW